jgi:hypothetical protein
MTFLEGIIMISILLCCTGGIGWLFYDMKKQLEAYKNAYEESTLGLVEDEEEE